MRASVAVVHRLVCGIEPADGVEARHRAGTLDWLLGTDDVFRRIKPVTPPRHLVSYVVPIDPTDGAVLLVDHIGAGLWLPPGGHVEPEEHPAATARREAREELGVTADGRSLADEPAFITVTRTTDAATRHTDVSLWFTLVRGRDQPLTPDHSEFRQARWWLPAELEAAGPGRFDPHLGRFLKKITNHR